MVVCRECGRECLETELVLDGRRQPTKWCRDCQKKYMKTYVSTHLVEYNRRLKAFRQKRKEAEMGAES